MVNTRNPNNAQRPNNKNTEHDQTRKQNFAKHNKTQYNNNKEVDLMNTRQSKVLKQFKIQTVFYRMF